MILQVFEAFVLAAAFELLLVIAVAWIVGGSDE